VLGPEASLEPGGLADQWVMSVNRLLTKPYVQTDGVRQPCSALP
jgi:hypothetical protein